MDCGPTCLRMVAKHHGKQYGLQSLRELCRITREGVSLAGIADAAEHIGMRSLGVRIGFEKLRADAPLPAVVHWGQNHFVVVYKISRNGREVYVADPARGKLKYTRAEFESHWASTVHEGEAQGVALLLEPMPDFYARADEKPDKANFKFLLSYLTPHRRLIGQLLLSLAAGSLMQLIFPFLAQSMTDFGIMRQNLNFVYLILAAQLVLYVGKTITEFLRSWILLHISTRINIALISDFLIKLMKLPIRFFDTKLTGDILQRIGDQSRIENFLIHTGLNIVFAFVNFIIFGAVMAWYSLEIFGLFMLGSALYAVWILFFMKKRRALDYKRFEQSSKNQSAVIQLITGMQEIKLHNAERQKRWQWERIQAALFRVNVRTLALNQYQQAGSLFINELKNILISFLSAAAVIRGDMTLGMLFSVQYIIGQLNSPIEQMLNFMQSAQDAKISLERMGEIHAKPDEESPEDMKTNELPADKTIRLNNVSFSYTGSKEDLVLDDIDLDIPEQKITAIVGTSGSGKTTLIKLLLGFYPPVSGEITVGNVRLDRISVHAWRESCGTVMQDGFIFSDTIAENIAVGAEYIDKQKLAEAVNTANIREHIESLPLRFNTKIGQEGMGLSQGQKQRMLIARAVYKNPDFLFFDEATNALDANNERIIMQNLDKFFSGRTVVVVAHRLSTVKHADKIVVLEKGKIAEQGSHNELIEKRGAYYTLVKNQLELGE